jgi:hypothetical protein
MVRSRNEWMKIKCCNGFGEIEFLFIERKWNRKMGIGVGNGRINSATCRTIRVRIDCAFWLCFAWIEGIYRLRFCKSQKRHHFFFIEIPNHLEPSTMHIISLEAILNETGFSSFNHINSTFNQNMTYKMRQG